MTLKFLMTAVCVCFEVDRVKLGLIIREKKKKVGWCCAMVGGQGETVSMCMSMCNWEAVACVGVRLLFYFHVTHHNTFALFVFPLTAWCGILVEGKKVGPPFPPRLSFFLCFVY